MPHVPFTRSVFLAEEFLANVVGLQRRNALVCSETQRSRGHCHGVEDERVV